MSIEEKVLRATVEDRDRTIADLRVSLHAAKDVSQICARIIEDAIAALPASLRYRPLPEAIATLVAERDATQRIATDARASLHAAKGCIADLRALLPEGSTGPRILEAAIAALPERLRDCPLSEAIAALAGELEDVYSGDRTIADLRAAKAFGRGSVPLMLQEAIAALPASMRALPLPEAIAALADELQDVLAERDAMQAMATMGARGQSDVADMAGALQRLLWMAIADDAECTCEEVTARDPASGEVVDVCIGAPGPDDARLDECPLCEAWSALGFGEWPGAAQAAIVLLAPSGRQPDASRSTSKGEHVAGVPADDMERIDNALARIAGDIANAREYTRRLTISLAEYESLPAPDDQPKVAEYADVLEDPRMDGTTWLEPAMLTRAMVASWPIWELREPRKTNADKITIWRSDTMLDTTNGECPVMLCEVEWRPLRLPGMDRAGVIQASEMTAEYFTRVRDWQFRSPHLKRWIASPAHITLIDDGEEWRPSCFAPRTGGEK